MTAQPHPLAFGAVNMPIYQGDAKTGMHLLVISYSISGRLADGRAFRVTIARGFSFDGCSIPRLLWRLCGHPMEIPRVAAALAHDWLYAAHVCDRALADAIYRAICLAIGMSSARAAIEYRALRWFGGSAWKSHGAADQTSARALGHLVLDGSVVAPAITTTTAPRKV